MLGDLSSKPLYNCLILWNTLNLVEHRTRLVMILAGYVKGRGLNFSQKRLSFTSLYHVPRFSLFSRSHSTRIHDKPKESLLSNTHFSANTFDF